MISRRNFLSIIMMVVVLCGIFMFAMFVQEQGSSYDINRFAIDGLLSGENRWKPSQGEKTVLFISNQNENMEAIVEQWCLYTKRALIKETHLSGYLEDMNWAPELILLDAENITFEENYKDLLAMADLGIPVVFCSLPPLNDIMVYPKLRELLGVKVKQTEVTVEGVRLFENFFFGGAAEYVAKTEEEEKIQDFNLNVPWLVTESGTKTYMVGVLDSLKEKNEIKQEEYPCLLWRNSYGATMVFSVCGDYMSSLAGLGILSAFVYELNEYALYPVVNAQSVIINNFPNFSEENRTELERLYSRSPQMYFQGVMWPGIAALAKTNALKLTCMFKPQYDYLDANYPKESEVDFYLKQLRELESEAGRSMDYRAGSDLRAMLAADRDFFESMEYRYRYQTAYVGHKNLEKLKNELGESGMLPQVVTVCSEYTAGDMLLSYLDDEVTLQRITATAEIHTFMEDFIVRSIQTALLYSNVMMDLKCAVWPEKESHQWQHLFKDMSSNIQTYWRGDTGLEQTTLSQSDIRVREFLNMDYSYSRTGNVIRLQIEHVTDSVNFLLRTHDEKIVQTIGAEYKELDRNMYLLTVTDAWADIVLEPLSLKELVVE